MNVLIVSDDRGLLRHVSRFLTTFGYETVQVADYQRAAEIAEAAAADLVIVDSDPDLPKPWHSPGRSPETIGRTGARS